MTPSYRTIVKRQAPDPKSPSGFGLDLLDPMSSSLSTPTIIDDIIYLSKDGGEAHDDAGQGRLDVLICVSDELLDAREKLRHDHLLLHPLVQVQTEVLHLVSSCSPDLRLTILHRVTH